jgi:hypothetical protein
MNVERLSKVQQIHQRLYVLECDTQDRSVSEERLRDIYIEMKELRLKLKEIMNSVCPVLKGI